MVSDSLLNTVSDKYKSSSFLFFWDNNFYKSRVNLVATSISDPLGNYYSYS
jgi:hypothetical protein